MGISPDCAAVAHYQEGVGPVESPDNDRGTPDDIIEDPDDKGWYIPTLRQCATSLAHTLRSIQEQSGPR
eukprot:5352801-Pyramimonas_sp.AAC.1